MSRKVLSKSSKDKKEKKSKDEVETGKVIVVEDSKQYENFKKKGLVIVDFNTTWCGPCKKFAPIFEEIAKKYPDTVFLSVDAEKIDHPDCQNISSVPTFKILLNGEIKRDFSGVDIDRLEQYIQRYQVQVLSNGKSTRSFNDDLRQKVTEYIKN